jgi:uncharacterized protein YukE
LDGTVRSQDRITIYLKEDEMNDRERRVLELAKDYTTKMRKAQAQELGNEADDKIGPIPGRILDDRDEYLSGLYDAAQDALQNLEEAVEVLNSNSEFKPLTGTQRSDLYKHAEILDQVANRIARLRNAYYGMAASEDTQIDFDRWDSEIIAEENVLSGLEKELHASQDKMNNW